MHKITSLHTRFPAPHASIVARTQSRLHFSTFMFAALKFFDACLANTIAGSPISGCSFPCSLRYSEKLFIACTLSCHLGFVSIVSFSFANSGYHAVN